MPAQVTAMQQEIKKQTKEVVPKEAFQKVYGPNLKMKDTIEDSVEEVMAKLRAEGLMFPALADEPDPVGPPAEALTNGAAAKKSATAKKAATTKAPAKKAIAKKPAPAKKAAATKAPAAKKLPPTKPRDRDEPWDDRNAPPEEVQQAQRRRISGVSATPQKPAARSQTEVAQPAAAKRDASRRTAKEAPGEGLMLFGADPTVLEKLRAAQSADKAMYQKKGWNPELHAHGATGFWYEDPLSDLLEDIDLVFVDGQRRTRAGRRPNRIIISQDEQIVMAKGRYRWRSREFYKMLERLLNALWIGPGKPCKGCDEPVIQGFTGDVKDFLVGKRYLPGTENVPSGKIARPPTFHDVCFYVREEMRDLKLALQGRQADDPESAAFRERHYRDALQRIEVKMRAAEIDITRSDIIKALRRNITHDNRTAGIEEQ